jgi:hypothetical protein
MAVEKEMTAAAAVAAAAAAAAEGEKAVADLVATTIKARAFKRFHCDTPNFKP